MEKLKAKIVRNEFADGYTMGRLYLNGKYFCDTLEDCDRSLYDKQTVTEIMRIKVQGQTAIPIGVYNVRVSYSQRFKRDVPLIEGVKGFSGVRIHAGNNARDTEGCVLLGRRRSGGYIGDSRNACNAFERELAQAGDVCELEICYE